MNADERPEHKDPLDATRKLWDDAAASFDNEPDHGLRDPRVRAAWTTLLRKLLPATQLTVLDIGCGTGSLSIVLAELNHDVIGVDLSTAMIAIAEEKAKAAGHQIEFHVIDAALPQLAPRKFDAIICRHLLWALPDPDLVLQRWAALLKPGGYLLLIEGFWHTGAGLHAEDVVSVMPTEMTDISVQDLSTQPDLWGGDVTDERYAIRATFSPVKARKYL